MLRPYMRVTMLLPKLKSDRTVWVQFRDTFYLQLKFLSRDAYSKLRDECLTRQWDSMTGQFSDVLDRPKFYRRFAEDAIVGWRGLSESILRALIDLEQYPAEELLFSIDDAVVLMQHAYGFDLWVERVCQNLQAFESARLAQQKKDSSLMVTASLKAAVLAGGN